MGRMSDLMIELENEKADQWIRDRLEDEDSDEESEEYKELADEYSNLQEHLREQFEFEEDLKWLKKNDSSTFHRLFLEEISELEKLIIKKPLKAKPYMMYRMTYAHSVSLLEAFIGETVKSLVNENDRFFVNSFKIAELKNAKYTLEFLATTESNPKALAIKELSKILYHSMPKVKVIFETILGNKINLNISEVDKITKIRHDIVHRNGKNKEGEPVYLDQNDIVSMFEEIKSFANDLQKIINKNA
ncbi:HEPN domain-containing protein [Shewanella woodyi]|uniref:HEPN domain-containing protein n=1 Tax=Shewanella woodyi TaxID=60961 RepID=UPI0007F955D1|nr:HEPN domain-containing protein [Shewanella woodyi]